MYQGRRKSDGSFEILADGDALDIKPSLKISNHSPTGFECAYGGSGPAQSALAILLDYTGKRYFAERYHQDFKWKYIATSEKNGFLITSVQVDGFIEDVRDQEAKAGRPLCGVCLCPAHIHTDDGVCLDCKRGCG
jgi:hypothetical protein